MVVAMSVGGDFSNSIFKMLFIAALIGLIIGLLIWAVFG
jgi:hypothetical protein